MSTQTVCNVFKLNLLKGLENFYTGTPYTYNIALYDSTAVLDADTTVYTATGEVVGTGYTAGGEALTPTIPVLDGDTAVQSFSNVTWSPAEFTARYALIYNATTSAAVAVLDFGADKTATNEFTVQFPTADAADAIIRVA